MRAPRRKRWDARQDRRPARQLRQWEIRRDISPICFGAPITRLKAIRPPQQLRRAGSCTRAVYNGDLPAADKTYLAQLVASRTGLSQPDAEKRVADVFDQAQKAKQQAADKAKEAADAARKTGVGVALWAFISLLVGAFSASYMATVGGRQRDEAQLFE